MTSETLIPTSGTPLVPRWTWAAAAVVIGSFVLIDWLSIFDPTNTYPITPWNPLLGVCIAVAMTHYRRGILLAFASATLTGLVAPDSTVPNVLAVLEGVVTAFQTAAIIRFAAMIRNHADHALLKNALVSTLVVSAPVVLASGMIFVATLSITGITDLGGGALHLIRFCIGNAIGVVICLPIVAMHLVPGPWERLTPPRILEAVAQGAVVLAAVWVAFGEYPETASRYLFVVFLPMIWIVLRFGLRGAIGMNAVVQASMIASLILAGHREVNVTLFQALLLVLATSSFIFGLAVDQSKAATLQLRAREEELSASLRVAATGELAGTLAHELGHPLGAISNYAAALNHVLRKIAPENAEAAAIAAKLGQEVVRATDTLHRMREFYRTGALIMEPVDIANIVKEAVLLLNDRLKLNAISPHIVVQGGVNTVVADIIQLRAVIYNLLVNAIDALKPIPREARFLSVLVRRHANFVTIDVEDSGPGVATDVRDDVFEPLVTTKKDGLGLGLSMSRSIIQAHGGSITLAESGLGGAKFIVTLPADT